MESLSRSRCLALMLDHDAVLSAWEKIGGSVFSCDDMVVPDDPQDVTLDLSLFEPPSSKDDGTALFSGCLFGTELPPAVPAGPPAQRTWSSSAHVVPHCTSMQFAPPAPLGMVPFPMLHRHPTMGMPGAVSLPFSHASPQTGPHQPAQQPISNVFSFESDDDVLEVPTVPNHLPKAEDVLQEIGPVASLSSCASDAGAVPDVTSPSTAHGAVQFQQLPVHRNGITSSSSTGAAGQRGRHMQQQQHHHLQQQHQQLRPADFCGVEIMRSRAECLERYRQKKARRMFTKKIRYQLRKINADKRPRIKGRFVKKDTSAPVPECDVGLDADAVVPGLHCLDDDEFLEGEEFMDDDFGDE